MTTTDALALVNSLTRDENTAMLMYLLGAAPEKWQEAAADIEARRAKPRFPRRGGPDIGRDAEWEYEMERADYDGD